MVPKEAAVIGANANGLKYAPPILPYTAAWGTSCLHSCVAPGRFKEVPEQVMEKASRYRRLFRERTDNLVSHMEILSGAPGQLRQTPLARRRP